MPGKNEHSSQISKGKSTYLILTFIVSLTVRMNNMCYIHCYIMPGSTFLDLNPCNCYHSIVIESQIYIIYFILTRTTCKNIRRLHIRTELSVCFMQLFSLRHQPDTFKKSDLYNERTATTFLFLFYST